MELVIECSVLVIVIECSVLVIVIYLWIYMVHHFDMFSICSLMTTVHVCLICCVTGCVLLV